MKKKAFKAALPHTLPICVGFFIPWNVLWLYDEKQRQQLRVLLSLPAWFWEPRSPVSAIPYFPEGKEPPAFILHLGRCFHMR